MSHFTVLVIGPDIEKQLQPFHEFECTGTNDEHVQDVDVTEECREHGLDWHGVEDKVVASEEEVDREGAHKYGYAVMRDGELVKAVNRTNPNKQWDWWEVGGRWSGFFKLKPGADGELGRRGLMGSCRNEGPGHADSAMKGAIDFEAMRDVAGQAAGERYDRVHAVIAGREFATWAQVREKHPGNIDAARAEYNAQPVVKDLSASELLGFLSGPAEYLVPREDYVQAARTRAVQTFAVLKDGQWYERGSMGWWGCVSGEKNPGEWDREFAALIDSLPDDTQLTVVDCHI